MGKLWNFIKDSMDRVWFNEVYKEDFEQVPCILCKTPIGYLYEYMEGSMVCKNCFEKFPTKGKQN